MQTFSLLKRAAWLSVILLALGAAGARADDAKPFLHPLFTDNMVLATRHRRPRVGLDDAGTGRDGFHERQVVRRPWPGRTASGWRGSGRSERRRAVHC